MVANEQWFANPAAHQIDYSCRFDSDTPAYLSKTFGTPTSDKIWTLSFWTKTCKIDSGNYSIFMGAGDWNGNYNALSLAGAAPDIKWEDYQSSAWKTQLRSNAKYRDPAAWYHIVYSYDSTPSTPSASSIKIFVNGVQITSFSTATYPSQNQASIINTAVANWIGGVPTNGATYYFDGYLAEVVFVDGTALDADSFGETSTITGQWIPKAISGLTFGNNGFHLDFANSSALGNDVSGNDNDFSSSGLAAADQVIDTPTDNFCTWNPQHREPPDSNTIVLSDGNLNMAQGSQTNQNILSTHRLHGKQYVEIKLLGSSNSGGTRQSIGVVIDNIVLANGESPYTGNTFAGVQFPLLTDYSDGSAQRFFEDGTPVTLANNETLCFAISEDDGKFWTRVNGGSWHNGDPEDTSTTGTGTFSNIPTGRGLWITHAYDTSDNNTVDFGQLGYAYTPPDGYKPVSTKNITAPKITTPAHYFQTTLFTGTGSSLAVDQDARTFEPDLVWIKNRDAADDHCLFDSVRGTTKLLISNDTDAEATDADTLTSFDSDGFTVGADVKVNTSTEKYVAWQWIEGATPGFDIVSYTGNATNRTISHSLGVAPEFMVVKNRADTDNWAVYHASNTAAPATDYLILNTTAATADDATIWNDTAPTSSVFSVGTSSLTNGNTEAMIAYLWAGVDGYSKFGSYTGNGNADGPFVWTGFKPRFLMAKRTNSTEEWTMRDSARSGGHFGSAAGTGGVDPIGGNGLQLNIAANVATEEEDNATGSRLTDFLSNGFKVRSTNTAVNTDGSTYVYMALAESPFKYATAR